jgi:hypothetical protein
VVEGHTVDDHEVLQVVLVRRVVAVPADHVEWRIVLGRTREKTDLSEQQTIGPEDFVFLQSPGE